MPPTKLSDIMRNCEMTQAKLAEACGCTAPTIDRLQKGLWPPNHPLVEKAARALGLDVVQVAAFCRGKPLDERGIERIRKMLHPRGQQKHRAEGAVVRRKQHALVAVHRQKRSGNALLRMDQKVRQVARSLAQQVTLNAMQGKAFMNCAVPVQPLAEILNDWFKLKGIEKPVVVDVDYDDIFG
jgi:transcriptional regulator with XRE-family HTH domain